MKRLEHTITDGLGKGLCGDNLNQTVEQLKIGVAVLRFSGGRRRKEAGNLAGHFNDLSKVHKAVIAQRICNKRAAIGAFLLEKV